MIFSDTNIIEKHQRKIVNRNWMQNHKLFFCSSEGGCTRFGLSSWVGGVMADAVAVGPVRRKVGRAGGRGGRFRALSRRMEGRGAYGMVWMCEQNYGGIVDLANGWVAG